MNWHFLIRNTELMKWLWNFYVTNYVSTTLLSHRKCIREWRSFVISCHSIRETVGIICHPCLNLTERFCVANAANMLRGCDVDEGCHNRIIQVSIGGYFGRTHVCAPTVQCLRRGRPMCRPTTQCKSIMSADHAAIPQRLLVSINVVAHFCKYVRVFGVKIVGQRLQRFTERFKFLLALRPIM
jgi:hypothetical protein